MKRVAAAGIVGGTLFLPVISAVWLILLASRPATAVPVRNLYAASVALPAESPDPSNDTFNDALGKVLVKVTGRRDASAPDYLMRLFPDPEQVVQLHRREDQETIWIQFRRNAIKRVLDGEGQPVWGTDRPEVLIWLALDAGRGRRSILSAESATDGLPIWLDESLTVDIQQTDKARVVIMEAAEGRGVPVLLPLMDAEDLSRLSFAELWGNFSDTVMAASARYGVEVVLIGRARNASAPGRQVRWTLLYGNDRKDWQGDLADGPNGTADWLGGRLATTADSVDKIRLSVAGVKTLEHYGQLKKYLNSIEVVELFTVSQVNGDYIEFDLTVRGDCGRLMRAMRGSQILQPMTGIQRFNADSPASPGYRPAEQESVGICRHESDVIYMMMHSP